MKKNHKNLVGLWQCCLVEKAGRPVAKSIKGYSNPGHSKITLKALDTEEDDEL